MSDIFSEAIETQGSAAAAQETPQSTPAQTPTETPAPVATDAGKTSIPATAPSTEPKTPSTPTGKAPTIEELQQQLEKERADKAHWQRQYQARMAKEQEQKIKRSLQQTLVHKEGDPDEEFDGRVSTLQSKISEGVSQALQVRDIEQQAENAANEIATVAKEHEIPDENLTGIYDLLYRFKLDKPTVLKDEMTGLDQLYNPTTIAENTTIHKLLIRGMAAEQAVEKAKKAGYAEGWAAREQQMGKIPAPTSASTPDQVALSPEQAQENAKWEAVRGSGSKPISLG